MFSNDNGETPKANYSKPELRVYGNLRTITLAVGLSGPLDNQVDQFGNRLKTGM